MSHAAPSLSGLAPRQSTFGVTTQKCLIAEPRLFEHAPATLCFDADAQLHIENTNRSVKVRLHLRAKLNERTPISLLMPKNGALYLDRYKIPATSSFVIKNSDLFGFPSSMVIGCR